ncbi:hypothetical protein LTS10_011869 [Elasticomyces elasticus]|nr:hypothetical protein LTS10_011869 [Elasticomyces elasticus]
MALATIVASHAFEPGVPRSVHNMLLNLARHNKTSCYEVCKPALDAFLLKKHDYDEENTNEQTTDEQNSDEQNSDEKNAEEQDTDEQEYADEQASKHLAATSCILECEHDKVVAYLENDIADILQRKAKVEKALRLSGELLQSMGLDSGADKTVWTGDGPVIRAQRNETGMRSLAYY